MIHSWDTQSDYLLSSRHSPLKIGPGEGGIPNDNDGGTSYSSGLRSKRSRRQKNRIEIAPNSITAVMKSVIDLCNDNSKSKKKRVQLDMQLKVNLLVLF